MTRWINALGDFSTGAFGAMMGIALLALCIMVTLMVR